MILEGRKTLVLGAGKSGVAAAKFLAARGAIVALHDKKPVESWTDEAKALKERKIGLVDGNLPSWLLDQIDLTGPNVDELSLDAASLFLLDAANEIDMYISFEVAICGRTDVLQDGRLQNSDEAVSDHSLPNHAPRKTSPVPR